MHIPLRPDSNDAAAPDVAGGADAAEAADGAAVDAGQVPVQSLAQTLANARAMLAGLGVSPPSTPASSKALSAFREQETNAAGNVPASGGGIISPLITRDSTDDTAGASASGQVSDLEEAEGDDGENDDKINEDEQEELGEGDDLLESASQRGTRETDNDSGCSPGLDVRIWNGLGHQAGSFELPSRLPTDGEEAADSILPPPPSAFLLASAAKAASQPPSQETSRRASEVNDDETEQMRSAPDTWDSPIPFEAASKLDSLELDNLEHEDAEEYNMEADDLEEDIAEEETASSEQHDELHRKGQPADVAEQQAVTAQPRQPSAAVPPRAPPPQPSIMQLQKYSAPKPTSRAILNAYADLAASLSIDDDDLNRAATPRDDAGAEPTVPEIASSSMQPGQSASEASEQSSPQAPPLFHHLAASGRSEEEAWFAGQELIDDTGSQEIEGEEAELLSGPASSVIEPDAAEDLAAKPAATKGRKVSFFDATG